MYRRVITLLALLAACSSDETISPAEPLVIPTYDPPPESCNDVNVDIPKSFSPCSLGSGIFGRWGIDSYGKPAYEYGLDQYSDERAAYFNTEDGDWRSHWAAFGNHRINAMFANDGTIEVVTQDRGVTFLNKIDEEQQAYGGGFGWIDDGTQSWSTAYRYRPLSARTFRRFGMGYAEATVDHRGIEARRITTAPPGSAPYVVTEVVLTNRNDSARSIAHYEYWDVMRRPIEINWTVSGIPLSAAPAEARRQRDERNGLFLESLAYDDDQRALTLRRTHAAGVAAPSPDAPDPVDYYPGHPFLVSLIGDVDGIYVDQAAFFGDGGPERPTTVAERRPGDGPDALPQKVDGFGQPQAFVMRSDIELAPGASTTLRYAYGYVPWDEPAPTLSPSLRDPKRNVVTEQMEALEPNLFYWATPEAPELHREMAWHSYQIEASVGRRDYWDTLVVPQGSAYLYLHGADGAARDLGLFAVPLSYTHPELAREELKLYMGITHAADKRFSYAFQGHGMLDNALGLHEKPSDLPLFFLWAMGEYIGATGDLSLLSEEVPYWPHDAGDSGTGYEHIVAALRHLFDVVGTGEHGLIRVQTGDWSDGIVLEAPDRDWAIEFGESVPNTQMAVAVLPRIADLVESTDAQLAAEVRERVQGYRDALPVAWTGTFYGRGFLAKDELAYADRINLEAQIWALLGDTFENPSQRDQLIAAIYSQLDEPSPVGASLFPGGPVWPAISGLLTAGYANAGVYDRAWGHLTRNTMAAHAQTYPDLWMGIWSGPDGVLGIEEDRPGEAWFSQVTPMTDYPVQNNNAHTMPMLAALRTAGITARATGLAIDTRAIDNLSMDTRLISMVRRPGVLRLTYRPQSERTVVITLAEDAAVEAVLVDGEAVIPIVEGDTITVGLPSEAEVEVRWAE